jgi:type IV pilus assembly protein PilV
MTEVIVAILILMVAMLGLLEAINMATNVGMKNQVREEAVYLGEQAMNELRAKTFDNISVNADITQKYTYGSYSVASRIRNSQRKYIVTRSAQTLATTTADGPVTKQLEVVVGWTYKGQSLSNRVVAPLRK